MAKKGRNLMGGRNPKRKKAVTSAVEDAMSMGATKPMKRPMATSPRPKLRPPMPTEEEIGAAERGNRSAERRAKEMPMMKAGGMAKKGYKAGGKLKQPGAGDVGLKKLPESVRNNMGYMAKGGMAKKGYKKGGKVRGAGIARKGVRPAKMV